MGRSKKTLRQSWERRLLRNGVKLFGTRWCAMCSKQKTLLSQICPDNWVRMYVDCDVLGNGLECSTVKKIPSWRVTGKWYVGAQSETSLRQLVSSTGRGMQRWDVAEYIRRHRRRGKWAKQEFADVVKRSILKARATAAATTASPSHVSHEEAHIKAPVPIERDKRGSISHNAARGMMLFAIAAVSSTQENFKKLFQPGNQIGTTLKEGSECRALNTTPHVDHAKSVERRFAVVEPKTPQSTIYKNDSTSGDNLSSHVTRDLFRASNFGRKPRVFARRFKDQMKFSVHEPLKLPQLHEFLRISEVCRLIVRRSLSKLLESLSRGLHNSNSMGLRLTGFVSPRKLKPSNNRDGGAKLDSHQAEI